MLEALNEIIQDCNFTVAGSVELPARAERREAIPDQFIQGPIGNWLRESFAKNGGLWTHQSRALARVGEGRNVVVSTGTASGKSLIFRSAALHRILSHDDERILVFYPLKALASDQMIGWRQAVKDLGLNESLVGRIDGSVITSDRLSIIENARIIIMTPDVCHAWLMSNLANPKIKVFVRSLSLVILDEAHAMEGVFGSNFAFLFRRLRLARWLLNGGVSKVSDVNVIAATATISNPAEHLHKITGLDFVSIGEGEDGSPQFKRRLIHLCSSDWDELEISKQLQVELMNRSKSGSFIAFVDSRKGAERLAVIANKELVETAAGPSIMPYRGGYEAADRIVIERRLKSGALRGVVSTSALELGIDIPHFEVGINLQVPATRKSFRQRIGRIGRTRPGAFVVVAEPGAFIRFGTSFAEYYESSVEPSHLYLDNRFMQFAHARCLVDELETLGVPRKSLDQVPVEWPSDFLGVMGTARLGGDRPREFDAIAMLGGDTPHYNYPLRNIGEMNFKIARGENAMSFGDIALPQAIRECYTGAIYYHMARAYKVRRWLPNAFQPTIQVEPTGGFPSTKPRIQTWINASLGPDGVLDGHYMESPQGMITECQMQITERVEGYQDGARGSFKSYRELQETNPNMRPRSRNFRTTGLLVRVYEPWFREQGVKGLFADRLKDVFIREHSVLPQDVGSAATNISIAMPDGNKHRGDCVVLYDETYGSLRLTERAFADFSTILDRLASAAEAGQPDTRAAERSLAEKLATFFETLESAKPDEPDLSEHITESGCLQVYAQGSILGLKEGGSLVAEVEIIEPTVMADGKIYYRVKCRPQYVTQEPVKRWVKGDVLEPLADTGHAYALWNPTTQEYVEEVELALVAD